MIQNYVKKCKYLNDFFTALQKVDSAYILYNVPGIKNGQNNYYRYVERVFAYEFYHQYRCVMKRKKKIYSELYLNGEQQKCSQVWKGLKKQTPDMVLHGKIGEADYSGFSQKWLCEIKMCTNPCVVDDLTKIKEKSLKLKFNYYIFLFVGGNDCELKRYCDNKDISIDDIYEDTICICVEIISKNNYNIVCKKLKEIIQSV